MSFLLKIVDGPMNGAEIALVEGLRVRVGSDAECDIVVTDASLPETAFELDVSAGSVSLICGEDVRTLVPFEIFEAGTSAFAIGPSEGVWEPLKRAVEAKGEGGAEGDAAPAAEGASAASSEPVGESGQGEAGADSSSDAAEEPRPADGAARKRWVLCSCCGAFVVLLVLLAVLLFFWSKIAATCPMAESARLTCAGWFGCERPAAVAQPRTTIADIARQYGLALTSYTTSSPGDPLASVTYPLLRGNLARKTERLAIRSLALSENPHVRFDLTDDETLAAAAGELLFVVTEGALKVAAASNRVVTLVGYAPSASSLERTIRALDADVKGIERVVTTGVSVGGPAPVSTIAAMTGEKPAVWSEAQPAKKAPRARGTKNAGPVRDFPIAGILTKPYPMVVMNNGMRLIEGAQIGDVIVDRIEADRLILKSGSTTFEWKP